MFVYMSRFYLHSPSIHFQSNIYERLLIKCYVLNKILKKNNIDSDTLNYYSCQCPLSAMHNRKCIFKLFNSNLACYF